MSQEFDTLMAAIKEATARIPRSYFDLAVAGREEPIVRERAYCYELYHQLQNELPEIEEFPFHLHGEIDKRGHPEYGDCLEGRNPDFVVHKPGEPGEWANLAVVEVKRCGHDGGDPTKDCETFRAFFECVNYHRAIALIYGGDREGVREHLRTAFTPCREFRERISLVWHSVAEEEAELISWDELSVPDAKGG